MKRIFTLLSILILMLVFSYYWEEAQGKKIISETPVSKPLYDLEKLGSLRGVIFPQVHILFEGENCFSAEKKKTLNKKKCDEFLDSLGSLFIKREFEDLRLKDKVLTRLDPLIFEFEQARLYFYLGQKVSYSRDFYVLVRVEGQEESYEKLVIAQDRRPVEGMYFKGEENTTDLVYKRFLSLYLKDIQSFQ